MNNDGMVTDWEGDWRCADCGGLMREVEAIDGSVFVCDNCYNRVAYPK